ncbi:hypothetical protein MWU54_16810 [Marivita sp. S6314]|uniref:hypothetical protein n=1 Tax=Marivita sp. S6314 TaxID=2926406 RepID=UPI001FF576AD|nr:hypothetical protein [Marivita sp. S6314]MCK0151706.1 hypothetical protein [Marivita sp. S6314]
MNAFSIFAVLFVLIPTSGWAVNAIARGGEHGTFTRATLQFDAKIEILDVAVVKNRLVQVEVNNQIVDLDTSRLQERLYGHRLGAVTASNQKVSLELLCDCRVDARIVDQTLLVVDIFDADPGQETKPIESINRTASAALIEAPIRSEMLRRSEASKLIKDAVASFDRYPLNTVAGPLVDVQKGPPFSKPPKEAGDAAEDQQEQTAVEECKLEDIIWSALTKTPKTDVVLVMSQSSSLLETDLANEGDQETLSHHVIESGDVLALQSALLEYPETDNFKRLMDALTHDAVASEESALRACTPLSEAVVATASRRNFAALTRQDVMTLIETIAALPLGWQLELYPRLVKVSSKNDFAIYEDLESHRRLEMKMSPGPEDPSDSSVDTASDVTQPDDAAALARVFKGTDHAVESWRAAQEAYLAAGRYFDALAAVGDMPDLSPVEKRKFVNRSLMEIANSADATTLLQIAVEKMPDLDVAVEPEVIAAVHTRLEDAGFHQHAQAFLDRHPNNEVTKAPSAMAEDSAKSTREDAPTPPIAAMRTSEPNQTATAAPDAVQSNSTQPSGSEADSTRSQAEIAVSVAAAGAQLATTEALRKSLSARFANDAQR